MGMAVDRKVQSGRCLAKDFHRLLRNIAGMSGGQARLAGWNESDLKKGITVAVVPDSGPYKDGEFMFSIACNTKYPNKAPDVYCKTNIYHPNIDTIEGDGEICLNMLDDDNWSPSMTLEDVVQGVLFLMHNPNLEDPLSVLFSPGMEEEEFTDNVRLSLDGGLVEGYHFERNRVVRGEGRAVVTGDGAEEEAAVVCAEMLPTGGEKDGSRPADDAGESKVTEERRKVGAGERGVGEDERGVIRAV